MKTVTLNKDIRLNSKGEWIKAGTTLRVSVDPRHMERMNGDKFGMIPVVVNGYVLWIDENDTEI